MCCFYCCFCFVFCFVFCFKPRFTSLLKILHGRPCNHNAYWGNLRWAFEPIVSQEWRLRMVNNHSKYLVSKVLTQNHVQFVYVSPSTWKPLRKNVRWVPRFVDLFYIFKNFNLCDELSCSKYTINFATWCQTGINGWALQYKRRHHIGIFIEIITLDLLTTFYLAGHVKNCASGQCCRYRLCSCFIRNTIDFD